MAGNTSREQRNKRVAIQAIGLLEQITELLELPALRDELDRLHTEWEAAGITWTRPPKPGAFNMDAWLPGPEIAELADVDTATVRVWHHRGHITAIRDDQGRNLYNVGDVVRYQARRTRRGA